MVLYQKLFTLKKYVYTSGSKQPGPFPLFGELLLEFFPLNNDLDFQSGAIKI